MTSHLDTYAALTALFTTSDTAEVQVLDQDTPPPTVVVPPRPRIECVVPGHLPVRAGVWFLPSAYRLAGEGNAGVLIQCEEDLAQLTAFGLNGASGDRSTVLAALAAQSRRWFLLPPSGVDPGAYPSLGVDRITILTGTDQAAVVAAYQTIKSIVAGCGAEREQLDLGLFIAGSSDDAAAEAAERLAETSRQQLGCDLTLRGSMHQLEAVDCSLHRDHVHLEGGVGRLVSDIRHAISSASEAGRDAPKSEVPMPMVAPPLTVAVEDEVPSPCIELPVGEPVQPVAIPPKTSDDSIGDSLASCVDALTELPIRCPHHASVELAVDAQGHVHVLGMFEELPAVLAVEAWARAHAELLSMACRDASIQAEQSPQAHIFAESAKELVALQGTPLRLHVLTTVEIGPHRTRHATALS